MVNGRPLGSRSHVHNQPLHPEVTLGPAGAAGQPVGNAPGPARRAAQYPRERSVSRVAPMDGCGPGDVEITDYH